MNMYSHSAYQAFCSIGHTPPGNVGELFFGLGFRLNAEIRRAFALKHSLAGEGCQLWAHRNRLRSEEVCSPHWPRAIPPSVFLVFKKVAHGSRRWAAAAKFQGRGDQCLLDLMYGACLKSMSSQAALLEVTAPAW